MAFKRLVLIAAAAAGAYYLKNRGLAGAPGLRERLSLGGGMGAAAPVESPVAETMWTPSQPTAASGTAESAPKAGG